MGRGRRSDATPPARGSRPRESRTRSSSSTPPRATSRSTRRATSPTSAAGPHLQDSSPIKAVKLTGLAGAYWRGDEKNTQLTRIYGTAFFTQADLDAYLERLEQARANDHRRLGPQLDLFHLQDASPGSPFWHPKGMTLWNVLEDLRRRENARRGYLEVKTPLIYDKSVWETSGHWEKFRGEMFLVAGEGEEPHAGLKPMNCPGHMLLFGSQLRSYRDLPLRYAESSTLHRNEPTGTLHGLLRVRHVTQDDAHIFCTREQIEDEIFGCLDYAAYLYDLFGMEARFELSTRPDNKLGTDEEWDFTEAALRAALERRGIDVLRRRGRGRVLRAEDRPPHEGRPRPLVADGDDPARRADAEAVRPHLHGRRQPRAHAVRRPPRAPRLARAVHGDPDRALRRRVPRLAGAGAGARAAGRRAAPRGRRRARRRAPRSRASGSDVDERDETLGKRIRDAELQKIPYVVVWGDRETREAMAVRRRGGEGVAPMSLDALVDEIRPRAPPASGRRRPDSTANGAAGATAAAPASRSGIAPHLAGHGPREVQPSRNRRGNAAAACSGVSTK